MRILLRSPKRPFEVWPLREVMRSKLMGENTGNLVFLDAAYRLLATPAADIKPDRLRIRPRDADRINAEHDVYVLPFANAFRPQYEDNLIRHAELIERLRIPVVVLGIGAQSNVEYDLDALRPLDRSVRRFVSAVLDRGPSVGVRGEFTERYLRHLGFRDVEVIGCPSVFWNGPRVRVEKRREHLGGEARLAFNAAPSQAAMGPVLEDLRARYPKLTYVAQDLTALELLVLGGIRRASPPPAGFPATTSHPLVREGRMRVFPEPWTWIEFLRSVDFVFGARAHGNLASLIAGTPCYMLPHDSRTLELARYFEVPHRLMREVGVGLSPAELYEEADYAAFNIGHAARWATFAGYLRRHGLEHVFEAGGVEAFDARMASLRFPTPGDPAAARRIPALVHRVRRRLA